MLASDDPIRKYEPLWGNWRVSALLGEGSYGRVYRVSRQDGGSYESAVKLISIPRSEADVQEARRLGMDSQSMYAYFAETAGRIAKEISIMHSLKGEANIVSYEDHQIFHEEGSLRWDILIRMELLIPFEAYVAGERFSLDETRQLGAELCSALEICAAYGIIHRDIKEANIFLNARGTFKLGDFGIARELGGSGSMSMSMRGTPAYIAPEVYNGRKYDERADIYSLGILMYKMLNNGRYPFLPPAPAPIALEDAEKAFSRRIRGETPPPPLHGDAALRGAVMRAINPDPHARFQSAADFKKALLTISSSVPGRTAKQKAAGMPPPSQAASPLPERLALATVYKPLTARTATPEEEKPQALPKAGKNTKLVLFAAVLLFLSLVLALTLPGLIRPDTDEESGTVLSESSAPSAVPDQAEEAPAPSFDPGAAVEWEDPAMGELIGTALGKEAGQVTYEDMAKLQQLSISKYTARAEAYDSFYEENNLVAGVYGKLKSLEDLRHCTELKSLLIAWEILDGLDPIAQLPGLEVLCVVNCKTPDGSSFDLTVLEGLSQLQILVLAKLDETDIGSLAQLTRLQSLHIEDLPIPELPDLSRLTQLQKLRLKNCGLTEVSGLSGLENLEFLSLWGNQISSLRGLENLSRLQTLYLNKNNITSIAALTRLDALTYLSLYGNDIGDWTPLLELNALETVFADGGLQRRAAQEVLKNRDVLVQ